jgi:Trk K+ transport system NAD-binding subunit
VVARAEQLDQVKKLQSLGVQVVQPALAMALALEGALHFPETLSLIAAGNSEFDLADVSLANPQLANIPLRELHLPGRALVLGIRRQGEAEVLVPNGDTVLRAGDILMLCGNTNTLTEATRWIEGKNES